MRTLRSLEIQAGTRLAFATVSTGKQRLRQVDQFVSVMSQFDRNARCHSVADVSQDEYLDYIADQVIEWSAEAVEKIGRNAEKVAETFCHNGIRIPLPDELYFVLTTGREEGHAAYTRGRDIMIPHRLLAESDAVIERIVAHELFHIAMRQDKHLETALYDLLGFAPCNDIVEILPASINAMRITNPDAPCYSYYKMVKESDTPIAVIPVLLARSPYSDGEFFQYLTERLIHVDDKNGTVRPVYENNQLRLLKYDQVTGYFDTLGRDTGYTYHPEEVLAKYFEFLYFRRQDLKDPQICTGMARLFA